MIASRDLQAGRLNIEADDFVRKRLILRPVDGDAVVEIVDEIALHTVKYFYFTLGCMPRIREGLRHTVIGDGDGRMSPGDGLLDDAGRVGQGVHVRHARVQVQLHALFRIGVLAPLVGDAHDAVRIELDVLAVARQLHEALYPQPHPRRNGISHRLGLLGLHVLADGHGVLVVRHIERQAPHARPPRLVALGGKDLPLKDDAAHLRVQPLHGDGLAANLLAHKQVGRAAAALIRLCRADVQAQLAQLILLGEQLLQRRARRLGDRLPALYLHFQQALCLIQRAAHDHRVMQQQPKIARRHKALEKIKKR